MQERYCDAMSLYIIVLQGYDLDKTYCSSNSILPGQLACGAATAGWSSRVKCTNRQDFVSYGVAGNREADCHRGLRPIKGMDAWAWSTQVNIP